MGHAGYELSVSGDGRGEGLFATRRFKPDKTVIVGEIERRLPGNHSHATQVGVGQYVLLGGFGSKVNHSLRPELRCACERVGGARLGSSTEH